MLPEGAQVDNLTGIECLIDSEPGDRGLQRFGDSNLRGRAPEDGIEQAGAENFVPPGVNGSVQNGP